MQLFTGKEYVQIAIANAFGLDKRTWKDRLDWVQNYTPKELYSFIDKADEPFLYTKAINTLEDTKRGKESGFIMGLDATASGLQIMACLTGCMATAINVNLIASGGREDVYNKIPAEMSKLTRVNISRARAKDPIMTTFYGSKAEPKNLFGDGTPELKAFYQVLNTELPGAMKLMNIMQSYWDPYTTKHQWELPDGHVVVAPVTQKVDKKIEVDELRHATFTHRADVIMPADDGLSLAANIIHSIDGYVVREMLRRLNRMGIQMAAIHDSFWAHPNDMNAVRQTYVEILADIANSHLISYILYGISGRKVNYRKRNQNMGDLILRSEYALS